MITVRGENTIESDSLRWQVDLTRLQNLSSGIAENFYNDIQRIWILGYQVR